MSMARKRTPDDGDVGAGLDNLLEDTETTANEVAEILLARVVVHDARVLKAETKTTESAAQLAQRAASDRPFAYQVLITDRTFPKKFLNKQAKYELAERIAARWAERAQRLLAELGGEQPRESIYDVAGELLAALVKLYEVANVEDELVDLLVANAIDKAKRMGIAPAKSE